MFTPMAQHRASDASSKYLLTLFVNGANPNTRIAVDNIERICAEELDGRYHVRVIDVRKEPQLAEDEHVIATPTLIKKLPPPLRRIIGDLSDRDRVLLGLDLRPKA